MKTSAYLLLLVSAIVSLPVVQGQSAPTNGLIAYYPFNGDAKDASGNGHDGTPSNAALTPDRFGNPDAAFAFNGTSSVITVPHSEVLNLTNTDFTISLWAVLNAPQTVSPEFYLVSKNNNGQVKWMFGYGGTMQYQTTRTIYFMQGNGIPSEWYADGRAYSAPKDTWHHYIMRRQGAVYTSFIDGEYFNSETNDFNLFTGNTAPLTIGRSENLSVEGTLDDIRLYNRALSDVEIHHLYASEVGPRVTLIRAVKPFIENLSIGKTYQLQVSTKLGEWSNEGPTFTATGTTMMFPQYWHVSNWDRFFFRVIEAP